ncbi:Ketose-bisphosphate aldolase [Tepidanaerobacter acetatoxydans Re1]|uniref:Ketose-bisphosphate aldolase n=1 Tax=Tepidanaerobacter acetatoxydans (strain DSM 21804 / JCM 16047 / Re1) TaxID=1209989 RepID=U4Q9G3_TEPAE|nr:Ketose-bisphosphate aldolase [Tepidanaerobacter acetatoxydans Re1]
MVKGAESVIVNLKEILCDCKQKKYAVGSFNVYNYETIKSVIKSSKEMCISTIVAFGEKYYQNMHPKEVYKLVNEMAERERVTVALHLDHCKNIENILLAIQAGFTSVMFDGSMLPFEENIEKTKRVVDIAHAVGVSVEAELGSIKAGAYSSEEGYDEIYTDPDKAKEFIEKTNVDALAVSIGTVHGFYKGEPRINLDILDKIYKKTDIPLVLHGGSGLPEDTVRNCIQRGICKINVNTEISYSVVEKMKKFLLTAEALPHFSELSTIAVEEGSRVVKKYMELFYNK